MRESRTYGSARAKAKWLSYSTMLLYSQDFRFGFARPIAGGSKIFRNPN